MPTREYLHLRRSVGAEVAPAAEALPAGYRFIGLGHADLAEVRRLRNDAFRDQGGAHSMDERQFEGFLARPVLSHALSSAVVDADGRLAAYSLVEHDPGGDPTSAYLASLAVDPHLRRRGVAAAVLSDLVHRARSTGWAEVALDVDVESESRATDLSLREGFQVTRRRISFVYDADPADRMAS